MKQKLSSDTKMDATVTPRIIIDKICIWHWAPAARARAVETDITVIKTPIYHLIWLPIS